MGLPGPWGSVTRNEGTELHGGKHRTQETKTGLRQRAVHFRRRCCGERPRSSPGSAEKAETGPQPPRRTSPERPHCRAGGRPQPQPCAQTLGHMVLCPVPSPSTGLTDGAADVALRFSRRTPCKFIVRTRTHKARTASFTSWRENGNRWPPCGTQDRVKKEKKKKQKQGRMQEQTDIDQQ